MPENPPNRGELGPDIVTQLQAFLESLVPNPCTTTQIRVWSVETEWYYVHYNLRCQNKENPNGQD